MVRVLWSTYVACSSFGDLALMLSISLFNPSLLCVTRSVALLASSSSSLNPSAVLASSYIPFMANYNWLLALMNCASDPSMLLALVPSVTDTMNGMVG